MIQFIFWFTASVLLLIAFIGAALELYQECKTEKIARAKKAQKRAERIKKNREEIITDFERRIYNDEI